MYEYLKYNLLYILNKYKSEYIYIYIFLHIYIYYINYYYKNIFILTSYIAIEIDIENV